MRKIVLPIGQEHIWRENSPKIQQTRKLKAEIAELQGMLLRAADQVTKLQSEGSGQVLDTLHTKCLSMVDVPDFFFSIWRYSEVCIKIENYIQPTSHRIWISSKMQYIWSDSPALTPFVNNNNKVTYQMRTFTFYLFCF